MWTTLPPAPNTHSLGAGAVVGGKFYVAGGGLAPKRAIDVYDPVTNTWKALGLMPARRPQALGAVLNGKFYVIGSNNADRTTRFYNTVTNVWRTWDDVGADRVVIRGETKTKGSERTVPLPASTMRALAAHRGQQEIEKIAAGNVYRNEGRVFASQTGGPLDLKNVTARHFKPLLSAHYALPPIRVYDLRHTHASHLLAAGTPVHVVSRRLGHASPVMTLNVYAHVLSGQHEDAVAKLDAYYAASV